MNKASFHLAFMTVLASTFSGCASPMKMFAKKPQSFDEYKAQHQTDQSRIAGSQSPRSGSAEVSELLNQGHTAFQQGNLQEAQSKYAAVVQRQPNHPVAHHRLGVIADRQQDYMTAQRHYFAALNATPNEPNLLNDIGYSFLLQSRYPEAENYLQSALQKNPKQSNAINNLGLLYAKQGQTDRALAMLRMTNSEAEAQAKLTRLMPSGRNAAPQAGQMIAQQGWPPPNAAPANPNSYNPNSYTPNPYNVAPANPAVGANGGQPFANSNNFAGATGQPPMSSQNFAGNSSTPPDQPLSNNAPPIAQTSGVIDPNLPESTRRFMEQMQSAGLKSVSDRQARDNAERQRQEMLKRQLRDDEIGRAGGLPSNLPPRGAQAFGNTDNRANIINPVYSQPNSAGRSIGAPHSMPPSSNAPLIIGPPPNANVPNSMPWQAMPDSTRVPNGTTPPTANGYSYPMPNSVPNSAPEPMPNATPNSNLGSLPNANADPYRNSIPPTGAGSPLDAMPNWPPNGSLPPMPPANSGASSSGRQPPLGNATLPNGYPPGAADDPARTASRLGMNAGPGNLFPITPSPGSGATIAPNGANSSNPFNNLAPPNGVSPTTPPNWPANPNQPGYGSPTNDPPAGTFGAGNFSTSANSRSPLPARNASTDQLPPSEWYQTPGRFGEPSTGGMQIQPASYGPNRTDRQALINQFGTQSYPTPDPRQQLNDVERASTRANVSDRSGGDERWENGAAPGTQSAQTSTPSMQGYLAAPVGDNSLIEYERMIQQHNAETNRIKQQLDEQRQLPSSENFRRSRSQPQTGTSSGTVPRS